MFTRAEHAGISVKDMERAIAFYRDVIGAEVALDREFGDELGRIIGVEGTRARIVHMRLGDTMIELFDYQHPQGRERDPEFGPAGYGLTHIGLTVSDFWGTYQRLLDQGVRFLGEALEIRPNVYVAYFYGVEGEILEMKEVKG
jgi:catechol 2,3-dioxygenase-like lactoylglutathione lyase family enzyme